MCDWMVHPYAMVKGVAGSNHRWQSNRDFSLLWVAVWYPLGVCQVCETTLHLLSFGRPYYSCSVRKGPKLASSS